MRSEQEWLEILGRVFSEAIPSARARQRDQAESGPDLVIEAGRERLLVGLKLVRGPRIPEVEGQLARSVLQLKRYAGSRGECRSRWWP